MSNREKMERLKQKLKQKPENRLKQLWNSNKRSKNYIIRVSEGEEKESGIEGVFE